MSSFTKMGIPLPCHDRPPWEMRPFVEKLDAHKAGGESLHTSGLYCSVRITTTASRNRHEEPNHLEAIAGATLGAEEMALAGASERGVIERC